MVKKMVFAAAALALTAGSLFALTNKDYNEHASCTQCDPECCGGSGQCDNSCCE